MSSLSAANRLNNISKAFPSNMSESKQIESNPTAGSSTVFGHIPQAPMDPILGTKIMYRNDTNPKKINLGIGAYRTNEGKPLVLPSVRKAEKLIANDNKYNHEYLHQTGDAELKKAAARLLFGQNSKALKEGRICTVQSLSGTGGLRVAGEFIAKFFPGHKVFMSNPTWGNHKNVMKESGIEFGMYRYWDEKTRGLDIDGMLQDLSCAPKGSFILLHPCAHNPTGVDPTMDQWKKIAQVIKEKELIPFLDCAYQGFATGDLERDAAAIRYFTDQGFQMLVCQSFAKNFGLYNERVGSFNVVCESKKTADQCYSQIAKIIRPMYSNPPVHGARIVSTILNSAELYKQWETEMKEMSARILETRHMLVSELKKLGTPGDWSHITQQIGMFSFTGLSPSQCDALIKKHHVYLLKNGRISMSGINTNNVAYLAKAIDDVVRNVQ